MYECEEETWYRSLHVGHHLGLDFREGEPDAQETFNIG